MITTTCPDCGGSVRQAFDTTDAYVSCRRCGHVFPSTSGGAARYCCKTCGAESPAGIGYAVSATTTFPEAAAGCQGYHFGDEVAK